MADTLTVVALDAADYELARRWECENILLDRHGPLETYVHGGTVPTTVEVWPTVATGLHARDHGIVANEGAQSWENPVLRFASQFTEPLPKSLRASLGRPFQRRGERKTFRQTDADHVFEDGYVFGWPGITEAEHLAEAWNLMARTSDEGMTRPGFEAELLANTGWEFAWVTRMSDTSAPIAGVHSHVLDIAGHAYNEREERLRSVYERVDRMLGTLRAETDRLVVLSDHGMKVSWVDDSPENHSMRALFSTTEDGPLPESVFDVREWLESRMADGQRNRELAGFDTSREQLAALGYVDE